VVFLLFTFDSIAFFDEPNTSDPVQGPEISLVEAAILFDFPETLLPCSLALVLPQDSMGVVEATYPTLYILPMQIFEQLSPILLRIRLLIMNYLLVMY